MNSFLRLWISFSFRQFRYHFRRTLAVLLGIGLGAAVFTSVRLATNASVQSFVNGVDAVSGRADRTVVNSGGRVPEELVSKLLRSHDIRAASPLMSAYVRVEGDDQPVLLFGIDPILDRAFRNWKYSQSGSEPSFSQFRQLLSTPYALLAGRDFLRRKGLGPGDSLRLLRTTGSSSFSIAGELSREGLATLEAGNVAICDISTFQEFTGIFGSVDRIDLAVIAPITDEKLTRIQGLLPPGILLEQPSEAKKTGQAMIRSYQLNLSVLSFVSLFVGMFLVYSLISLHATSRRKELAVLRSLGASSRMLFSLFVAEGLFFGLAGWTLAIPLSLFLTGKLLGYVSSTISHLFVRVHVEGLGLTAWEIFLSLAITLLVSVLAACQPAIEASRVRAREALLMRDAPTGTEGRLIKKLALSGLILVALVWPLSRLPAVSGVPIPGYLATFFLFLGFALLSPLCLKSTGSFFPDIARSYFGGETAYLGTRYLKSAGARVAISAGALITAIGLFAALVIMVHSFRDTVYTWVHQSINGDLYVRAKMSDINKYRDPLPAEITAELQEMADKIDIVPYRRIPLSFRGTPYILEPIDIGTYMRRSGFLLLKGDPGKIASPLEAGNGVVVSEVFSNQTGLDVGDRFTTLVEGTELNLPILGVIRDYRTQGGVVHCSLSSFERAVGDYQWTGASIFFKDRGPDLAERIAKLKNRILLRAADRCLSLEGIAGSDLRRNILIIFDETFAITTVLLFISLMIAALGIATTLTILVLERATQFQTMIATGASAWQVRAVISWEAVTMVILGEALGLACGFVLSVLLIFVINEQSFGWTFIYSVDWKAIAASFPLVCATALLAAIPAAQVVFRLPPALALKGK